MDGIAERRSCLPRMGGPATRSVSTMSDDRWKGKESAKVFQECHHIRRFRRIMWIPKWAGTHLHKRTAAGLGFGVTRPGQCAYQISQCDPEHREKYGSWEL